MSCRLQDQDRLAASVDETVDRLQAFAEQHHLEISADLRVSERNAAYLLGIAPGYLKALRLEGNGPSNYALGVGGSRYSYRLRDLAIWIEMARDCVAR